MPTTSFETKLTHSVLIIDENPTTLRLYENFLQGHFTTIHLLQETKKALHILKHKSFDLIIIDFALKEINGLELIERIKELKIDTPIILTAFESDNINIFRSINLQISFSLQKPFTKGSLLESISQALKSTRAIDENSDYHHSQQKRAFLKEQQAIVNDFSYCYHKPSDTKSLWYIDGSYRPCDILSGDTYSIRRLDEERCFFFIIDAMGKGVSASVTSILASSYINHSIDNCNGEFELGNFIKDFNTYIIKNLLDEEVLSVVFAEFDFSTQVLKVSSYAMPSVLLCSKSGLISKIKSNNQPISRHNSIFNIQSHELTDIKKMLFFSDGLVESRLENGELYFSHLKDDFKESHNRFEFLDRLNTRVKKPDDDITMLYFNKRDLSEEKYISLSCKTSITEVGARIEGFHNFLKEEEVSPIYRAKLGMIFSEIIMNAYEHGNLGISSSEKKELILKGELKSEYEKREKIYAEKIIKINYSLNSCPQGKELIFDIEDEGEGFNTKLFKKLIFDKTQINGRGLKIVKKMADAIYYSPKGNHVIVHKYIPKEI